jgi:hypothetical protein
MLHSISQWNGRYGLLFSNVISSFIIWRYCDVFAVTGACSTFAGFLTPTRRVSWYPRRVIKGRRFFADYSLFTHTALTVVTTLIMTIPLGTYNSSSWYILSCPVTAVFLSLLWTNSFTCSVVCTGHFSALSTFHYCRPFSTGDSSLLTAVHWLLFAKCSSFYSPGPYSIEDTVSNCLVVTQRVWLLWGACLPKQRSIRRIPRQHSIVSWGVFNCSVERIAMQRLIVIVT